MYFCTFIKIKLSVWLVVGYDAGLVYAVHEYSTKLPRPDPKKSSA